MNTKVLIVGGSFGGVSAALACAKMGVNCILVSDTDWIGGQATTQGVPLDEHPWIEQYGRTRSYAEFRNRVRKYYKDNYPLTVQSLGEEYFNPGACWVSGLGFEPRVGLIVLYDMLAPYLTAGVLEILTGYKPISAETDHDRCNYVTFAGKGETLGISANYMIDATELGDLMELTGTEHTYGAESQRETGEPLALPGENNPMKQQPFTHLAALSYHPGENHVIGKPNNYEVWKEKCKHSFVSHTGISGANRMSGFFSKENSSAYDCSIWNFRRCFCKDNFAGFASDITTLMIGNEFGGVLIGVSEEEQQKQMQDAKDLTLSCVYYLQTEIENGYRGNNGFPGIRMRGDAFGTKDGLAQYPYIRESRRLKAEFTVLEQHFRIDQNPEGPVHYFDSVGLGGYRIDIHEKAQVGEKSITTSSHGKHWTQQIPLGAFIPVRMENLLPACKNLGVTHITNGAFRLHPVEWNIGEAAGFLSAYCILKELTPRAVRNTKDLLEDFQKLLVKKGVELEWPKQTFGRSYNSHYAQVPQWHFGETSWDN